MAVPGLSACGFSFSCLIARGCIRSPHIISHILAPDMFIIYPQVMYVFLSSFVVVYVYQYFGCLHGVAAILFRVCGVEWLCIDVCFSCSLSVFVIGIFVLFIFMFSVDLCMYLVLSCIVIINGLVVYRV